MSWAKIVCPWFTEYLREAWESHSMMPKQRRKIEIEKTHLDPFALSNQ